MGLNFDAPTPLRAILVPRRFQVPGGAPPENAKWPARTGFGRRSKAEIQVGWTKVRLEAKHPLELQACFSAA